MLNVLRSLSFVARHPLNRGRPLRAVSRVLSWQLGMRLLPGAVAVPFVGDTRLLVTRGMAGATGNVYCGLHEFEDMAFVLHALRPGDLFVDAGANVGAYTVLAAGAAGARALAIEPIPGTFTKLLDNIRLNDLAARVMARNVGLGREMGTLEFTKTLDTVNHVAVAGEAGADKLQVPVVPLDDLLAGTQPAVIKIDVEGFESEVIKGAEGTLRAEALLAVLMELNGSGARYGFSDEELHRQMLSFGFQTARYMPDRRELQITGGTIGDGGNTLYVRKPAELQERLKSAPRHAVHGRQI